MIAAAAAVAAGGPNFVFAAGWAGCFCMVMSVAIFFLGFRGFDGILLYRHCVGDYGEMRFVSEGLRVGVGMNGFGVLFLRDVED